MPTFEERFELNTRDHPMGKGFVVSVRGSGDVQKLADHAGIRPDEAREILKTLIDRIPDNDLVNFLGAQVDVVS